ncbi:MAG: 50S ribosomal protein L28 [Microgenomates bacterium OLB23]|nr:MAG: 50S ribosomal protein L28 [Microgenomates bacterium OLB23]
MANCYVSGKSSLHGRTHTHHRGVAGGRWKKRAQKMNRVFSPNLQVVTILEEGVAKKVLLATKVIKRIRKDILDGRSPIVKLAYLPADLKKVLADRKAAQAAVKS